MQQRLGGTGRSACVWHVFIMFSTVQYDTYQCTDPMGCAYKQQTSTGPICCGGVGRLFMWSACDGNGFGVLQPEHAKIGTCCVWWVAAAAEQSFVP